MDEVTITFQIKVVLLREEHGCTAQGLEHDIAAQGENVQEAQEAFGRALRDQVLLDLASGRKPLSNIPAAPAFYWEKFNHSVALASSEPMIIGNPTIRTSDTPNLGVSAVPPVVRADSMMRVY